MTPRNRILIAAAVLAAGGLLAWAFAPRPLEVDAAAARRARFEQTIDEEGRTRLRDRYTVSAPVGGHVQRITLRAGDAVKAGQVVAVLRPQASPMLDERTRQQARAAVDAAAAQLRAAEARVQRARVSKSQADDALGRTESLRAQAFVSPAQVDDARRAASAAAHDVEAAAADRLAARGTLEQARAAAQRVVGAGGEGVAAGVAAGTPDVVAVRAPVAGRVTRVAQASEGPVAPGAPLVELGDTRAMEVLGELLTADAVRARPGSPVRLTRWGGEGVLEGRVREVEPSAFTKVSALGVEEQRVNVLVDLTSPPAAWASLGDGFRVELAVVTMSLPDALVVPVGAVFPLPAGPEPASGAAAAAGAGPMGTFIVAGGRARLRRVDVGARNGTDAWIRQGLSAGDRVVLYPPVGLKDGDRVHVRP